LYKLQFFFTFIEVTSRQFVCVCNRHTKLVRPSEENVWFSTWKQWVHFLFDKEHALMEGYWLSCLNSWILKCSSCSTIQHRFTSVLCVKCLFYSHILAFSLVYYFISIVIWCKLWLLFVTIFLSSAKALVIYTEPFTSNKLIKHIRSFSQKQQELQ